MVRLIAERLQEGDDATELTRVVEFVAGRYPRAWISVADLALEAGEGAALPDPVTAIRRYLEVEPGDVEAWRKLGQVSRTKGDAIGEMNARMQLATQPNATMSDISDAANRFNYLLSERELSVESGEKRVMAERLRTVMTDRAADCAATDLSRLAWLCLHLGDRTGAAGYTREGLDLDPTNHHCLRLASKLQILPTTSRRSSLTAPPTRLYWSFSTTSRPCAIQPTCTPGCGRDRCDHQVEPIDERWQAVLNATEHPSASL